MAEYWSKLPAEEFSSDDTPLHEALHAAVTEILEGEPIEISLNVSGGGETLFRSDGGWKEIATTLAPALVGTMSKVDYAYVARQNSRRRGYAWGWLKKNKRRIIRRAKAIERKIGKPPGKLKWDPERMKWKWQPRKRRNA